MFHANGFWALRIPRNERGAQPFDILAIKDDKVYAVDCKVCARKTFSLDRIEDNQWIAMEIMAMQTNAIVGFLVYHNNQIFFLSYFDAIWARKRGLASIDLDGSRIFEISYCEDGAENEKND